MCVHRCAGYYSKYEKGEGKQNIMQDMLRNRLISKPYLLAFIVEKIPFQKVSVLSREEGYQYNKAEKSFLLLVLFQRSSTTAAANSVHFQIWVYSFRLEK